LAGKAGHSIVSAQAAARMSGDIHAVCGVSGVRRKVERQSAFARMNSFALRDAFVWSKASSTLSLWPRIPDWRSSIHVVAEVFF
jgi:hypothetical protein